ncbi:cell wall-binding repeat-containing protein [Herbiconiux liukaitaii]|uniref:cell wall-binding repeat-containing protein n=1 Tax=Herbiconiux liukaitaii TaxID=3342799 RepID=UPI0035B9F601
MDAVWNQDEGHLAIVPEESQFHARTFSSDRAISVSFEVDSDGLIVDRTVSHVRRDNDQTDTAAPLAWSAGTSGVSLTWSASVAPDTIWTITRDGEVVSTSTAQEFTDGDSSRTEAHEYTISATDYTGDDLNSAQPYFYSVTIPSTDESAVGRSIDDPTVVTADLNADIAPVSAAARTTLTADPMWMVFIPDRQDAVPALCVGAIAAGGAYFTGDNRGFTTNDMYQSAIQSRTYMQIQHLYSGTPLKFAPGSQIQKGVGMTRLYNASGNLISEQRASSDTIYVQYREETNSSASWTVHHYVADPLCPGAPTVDYLIDFSSNNLGWQSVTGYHDQAPNHELRWVAQQDVAGATKQDGCWYKFQSRGFPWLANNPVTFPQAFVDLDANPLAAAPTCVSSLPTYSFQVNRVAGADRYSASVAYSQYAFPSAATGAPVVWVASGETFPDALSAGPAAAKQGGPLLLTTQASLPASVQSEIQRLHPQRIVIAGGPNSVSETVRNQLQALVPNTVRIGGADRYEVSRNVATHAFPGSNLYAYVATGVNYPDAVSAGAAAAAIRVPLILVYGQWTAIDGATASKLASLSPTKIRAVGGPASLTNGLVSSLNAVAPAERISGADRYQASLAANGYIYGNPYTAFIATGTNFPDALTGSAAAARKSGPLFLVPGTCIPADVLARFTALNIQQVVILGGPSSVSNTAMNPTVC